MLRRSLYKIGKKLCFPDVPSTWFTRTVESIQGFQGRCRRKDLSRPKGIIPAPPKLNSIEVEKELEQVIGCKDCWCLECSCSRKPYNNVNDGVKDGFVWSQHHWSQVTELFDTDHIQHYQQFWRRFKEGEAFDVISLLSTTTTPYLVRNNGDTVLVETLRGKNILVCCFFVPCFWKSSVAHDIRQAITWFSHLNNKYGNYEMVMVAKMRRNWADDEDAFNHFFSGFPSSWLAVPFSDTTRRHHVTNSIGLGYFGHTSLLVDPNQKVVEDTTSFWGHGFPDMLDETTWWKTHSQLESILDTDHVFKMNNNNNRVGIDGNTKVSISQLKDKLVCLYLCSRGHMIRTLDLVSQECKARNQDFQIVMVYIPYNKNGNNPSLFQEAINHVLHNLKICVDSNWWVAPFNEFVSRTLWEVSYPLFYGDQLVIFDPRTNTVDPYAKDVLDWFGINAYPFTRESLVQRELEALRAVTLESLLVYGSRDYVLRTNEDDFGTIDQVPIEQLRGKVVLLYLDAVEKPRRTYYKLREWYNATKTPWGADFEVVWIHTSSSVQRPMPWLWCPYDPQHTTFVLRKVLNTCHGTLVAFGKDGHIITTDAVDLLDSYGPSGFTSYDGLLGEIIYLLDLYKIEVNDMFDE